MELLYGVSAVFLLVMLAGIGLFHKRKRRMNELPATNPEAFLQDGLRQEGKRLVAVIGGDFVHGTISYNFVEDAARRKDCQHYQFMNAGINGSTVRDVLARLDAVIMAQPEAAIILVGMNDAAVKIAPYMAKKQNHEPKELPPLIAYEQDLARIVSRLKTETSARIALLSLPIAGENLFSKANREIDQYNEVIKKVAETNNVSYLPLNEKLKAHLKGKRHTRGRPLPEDLKLYKKAVVQHFVYGHSLDRISRRNGYLLLTDGIHLNSIAGMKAARQIELFLKKSELKATQ